jgi:hypothetical protein
MSDEQLNTAIDEVARQMTEGSPAGDAGFRRRVLARIESGDAPRRSWRAAFVLSPIAVAAAIVISIVVARSWPAPLEPGVLSSTQITAGPKGPALHETARRPGPSGPGDRQTVRRPGPFGPGLSGAAPHLDPIDAIALQPLGVDPLASDPIPTERLETIVPLVIAPLDSVEEQRRYERRYARSLSPRCW